MLIPINRAVCRRASGGHGQRFEALTVEDADLMAADELDHSLQLETPAGPVVAEMHSLLPMLLDAFGDEDVNTSVARR